MSSPDYLPARMLNEYVYCPRLFYYEWVEGLFAHNQETVEGAIRHAKLDAKEQPLPTAEELGEDAIHSRSVQLSSDQHQLIAKMDLVESAEGAVTPVDYKRGAPFKLEDGTLSAWDTDQVQLAVQGLVLRDNGYTCNEGIVFYVASRQRVRIEFTDELIAATLAALRQARELAESQQLPPPLVDSPKCPRCSLVGICLPDETRACTQPKNGLHPPVQKLLFDIGEIPTAVTETQPAELPIRRLVPARDDLRPLYLNTQGLYVGKSGGLLKIKEKQTVVQEVRLGEVSQVNLFGNIQITTQALQTLCESEIPVAYYSQGGWFYGITQGLGLKNIFLRREQFRWADIPAFCLRIARALVVGKIKNQRTLLQRNHVEPPRRALDLLRCYANDAAQAESLPTLLGIEGNAARTYFEQFAGMLKVEDAPNEHAAASPFSFHFEHRNRRPPRDPVNALLSLAYSVLAKDLTITCQIVGFDPFIGYYHQPRFGRPALALDLMEPFRPLIAESAVLSAINTRMISESDFITVGQSVALKPGGRKAFFRAYEQRMDTLITHPLFGYRVNYRRILEIQTRLLARLLTGELNEYPVFTTR